jgi:cell wall-associated NlpC family hydrolase
LNGKRRALLCVPLVVLLTALIVASPSSSLTLKQRLHDVQQKLNVLYTQSAKAVETYDSANAQLQAVNQKIKSNEQLLKLTEYNLAIANQMLRQQVVQSYKQRQVEFLDVLLSTQNFDQLVTQLDAMSRFSSQDSSMVTSIKGQKQKVIDLRVALSADKVSAKKLVAVTKRQKDAVQALVAKQQSVAKGLQSQIKAQERAAALAAQQRAALARIPTGPIADPGGTGHTEAYIIAQRYLGVPYVWGGASPAGFDCSGLVMYVYAQIGISLPHGATMQQQMSTPVPISALQQGDLVFFGGPGYSYHVGIYAGNGQMIAAPHTGAVVSYCSIAGAWIGGRP